ncbi:response regulator receiver domain-containing protein [Paraburkholderia eburnea]|uniref:Response regulator receiver domain-containing protein n=1 Tax=Paraburkholderia eburnea TaxID=1189126 RepID=A0A2S4MFP8_9BURK|nr:response regulator [Paraburkholderia eburnea]POR53449.1 response regulator receiver domain-containing protein [Paraburkholderia eburnea]PRZ25417.1 response regulator receiver domain-containing protein [Paraburkholderia eburnea]
MTHGEDTGNHADDAQDDAPHDAHDDYRAALAGERVSIVLIEDDDGHATLVERNLRRSGVSNGFLRFRDGQDALDYFFGAPGADGQPAQSAPGAANAPGLPSREDLANFVVLLDLRMPRVDGFEVLRRLKAEPATASVPVIVLTTTDDPREIERCYELGCNVYITKPVEYDAFIEAVRRLGFFLQVVKLPAGHRFSRP